MLQLGTNDLMQLPEKTRRLAEDSISSLTWSSRDHSIEQIIDNGSIISGDHIRLNGSIFTPNLVKTKMHIWNGFIYTATNDLVNYTPGGIFWDIINPNDFSWTIIEGVQNGDCINVTCEFANSGCDIFFWNETDPEYSFRIDDAVFFLSSNSSPVVGSFTWTSEYNRIYVGCISHEPDPIGNWTIEALVGNHKVFIQDGSSVYQDTYFLDSVNQEYNVRITGLTETNETITAIWENVTICNFYTPVISSVHTHSLLEDARSLNISWSCYDNNSDDVNYYQIWLSNNDGISFMLLTGNITKTWYIWNTTGWFEDSYTIRVRAFSVDFSSPKCSLEHPPSSYWPGDYSDGFVTIEAGDFSHPPPGDISLDIDILGNSYYYYGTTGNILNVSLNFHHYLPSYSIDYSVTDNGSTWLHGVHRSNSFLSFLIVNIDGLEIGHHILEITIMYSHSKTYEIDVIYSPLQDEMIRAFTIGVSIASISIIAMVIILSIRLKRNQIIEIIESD